MTERRIIVNNQPEIIGYGTTETGEVKPTTEILIANEAKVKEFLSAQLSLVKADSNDVATTTKASTELAKAITDSLSNGVHYGVLPGTETKMLFQAGTDILVSMFGLVPEFEIVDKTIIANGTEYDYLDYDVKATIMYQGMKLKEALASCSSHEYRNNYQSFSKTENKWTPKPNKSVFETKNTVLAMAQKRAESRAIAKLFGLKSEFTEDLGNIVTDKQKMSIYSSLYAHGKRYLPKGYAYETKPQKERSKEYMKKHFLPAILDKLKISQSMSDWTQEDLEKIKSEIKLTDWDELKESVKVRK